MQSNIFIVSAAYLFKYFYHVSFKTKRLQKKVSTCGQHMTILYFTKPVDRKQKTFKGYLCYKTITSQNVPFEAQIKNFLFRRNIMFCSQDIHSSFCIFNHPRICQICNVMMSIST